MGVPVVSTGSKRTSGACRSEDIGSRIEITQGDLAEASPHHIEAGEESPGKQELV